MNYSIIKDIFSNNRISSENMPVSEEQKKIVKKLFEFEEKLKKYLPAKEREKLMEEYSFLHAEVTAEAESSGFTEGFKAGLLVGAEVFSDLQNNN